MCDFNKKIEDKRVVIGYKVARKIGKHYYSFATGIEYKKGPVTIPKKYGKYRWNHWGDVCRFLNRLGCYIPQYKGYTAVFKNLEDAKRLKRNKENQIHNLVVLEMTLKGDLFSGQYFVEGVRPLYLGKEIVSIKLIKEE